jgi:AAA+ superfamily predicted ATPase/ATP-dependent Clp protease adapter protein ClpS
MRDVPAGVSDAQVIVFDDDDTPFEFVVDLIRSVFGRSETEAFAFAATSDQQGKVVCGTYPPEVAVAILKAARQRIEDAGHPLRIIAAPIGGDAAGQAFHCGFCGEPAHEQDLVRGDYAPICASCVQIASKRMANAAQSRSFKHAHEAITWHFAGLAQDEIVTTSRQFPGHMRADVQVAVDSLFGASPQRFFGLYEQYRHETLTFAALTREGRSAVPISAVQLLDVDIGEDVPIKCLNNGLWLNREREFPYAVVLSLHREYDREAGIRIEIAVPAGEDGAVLVQRWFSELETAISLARSYRGKVLSFEGEANYRGRSRGIMVHRLPNVRREEVVLPEATLKLLDRNVIGFIESRDALRKLGQSTRKGILLYGPPGTGKTHTIRYLAANLPSHTTLIITAGQMGLLSHYMALARLLQPAMVVIEDVDLIARDREDMDSSCEESLLNALLNEMDGLKDNADILFVLTTNRPEQLEGALAGRPGRIDQAIEVPLPDEGGRAKLVGLYGGGLALTDAIVTDAVARTSGVSAAFIKELMRRIAQSSIMRGGDGDVSSADLAEALDDMLFTGGNLNVRLLGGADGGALRSAAGW